MERCSGQSRGCRGSTLPGGGRTTAPERRNFNADGSHPYGYDAEGWGCGSGAVEEGGVKRNPRHYSFKTVKPCFSTKWRSRYIMYAAKQTLAVK